jgi:hypothetical protein
MSDERFLQGRRQHAEAVFEAFSISYDNVACPEVKVLDAQSNALAEPQSCTVKAALDRGEIGKLRYESYRRIVESLS